MQAGLNYLFRKKKLDPSQLINLVLENCGTGAASRGHILGFRYVTPQVLRVAHGTVAKIINVSI